MEERRRTFRRIECHLKNGKVIESWQPNECINIEALADIGYYNENFVFLNYTNGIDHVYPKIAVPINCIDHFVDTGITASKAVNSEDMEYV